MKLINYIREQPFMLFFYGASFLLLYEWLNPLKYITDTEKISVFIFFVALSLCNYALKMNVIASMLLKWIYIFSSIHFLYMDTPFLSRRWVADFLGKMVKDIRLFWTMDIYGLSSEFRSVLFFILLWLLCYLVYYWVFIQKRIFLFFFITLLYITLVDTFSPYDASNAIIRTIVVGFLFISMLAMERMRVKEFPSEKRLVPKKWASILVSAVLVVATAAYFLPKIGPQWPDPVPFLKRYANSAAGKEGSSHIQKVGYGINDSQLGGPFIGDETIVFYADSPKKHYWRIETKDFYSGKGWEVSERINAVFIDQGRFNLFHYTDSVAATSVHSNIQFVEPSIHLMYPLSVTSIKLNEEVTLKVNPLTEKLYPYRGEGIEEISGYQLTYMYPTFQVEKLQESLSGSVQDDEQFKQRYTQLPSSLPARIGNLARDITKEASNRYEQVKAIERYFEVNPYIYDTQNVAVPGNGEDYVDQFLFETKRGYCDNFSTSMVVMLRTLNIPSRWVKGYTYGKAVEPIDAEYTRYEITQNDAHSWVEVYFPNIGWVPFEPTKSFSNPYNFTYDSSSLSSSSSSLNEQNQTPIPKEKEEKKEELKTQVNMKKKGETPFPWRNVIVSGVVLLGAFAFVYFTKNKWFYRVLIILYKRRRDESAFEDAYLRLLKQLEKQGIKREDGQTLSQYAKYVDHNFESWEMRALTERYERILYRKDDAGNEWNESVELWENLIKKTSS
ncbi:transglutaminase TgpA family protein [Priestia abyssalis]|uniref:transglutaminase TgpA family protein n=1 Tax=Priestia abyssalis TaxID=1221450 RepID=UPI00099587D0|nr:transglutaminaseTgpA domain-containing protein [Priestia abyssalis]